MRPIKPNRKGRTRVLNKQTKKVCAWCPNKAIFIRRSRRTRDGVVVLCKKRFVKTDKDHDLCPRCRRSIGDTYYTENKKSREYR